MQFDILVEKLRTPLIIVGLLATVGAFGYVATMLNGLFAGVAFVTAFVLAAITPAVAITSLREGLPNIVGIGLAIAGQIAFGKAALVRRDDGRYEWTVLRVRDHGFVAELKDGREVPIDAVEGDLYAFGFGRLAITEQKTDANLSRWTVSQAQGAGGTVTRYGFEIEPPRREDGGKLVSLPTTQKGVKASKSAALVDRGHDKALDEEGGEGGVSELWTMGFATILLIVGFGMTFVALSL